MMNAKQNWSTKRMVGRVRRFALKHFLLEEIDEHGYTFKGGSYYFSFPNDLTVRVSDHRQAEWGGYDVTTGDRHIKSDISLSPNEQTFDDFLAAFANAQAQYLLDEWTAEIFGRYDEIEHTIQAS